MKTQDCRDLIKQLASIVGIVGTSILTIPVEAGMTCNPYKEPAYGACSNQLTASAMSFPSPALTKQRQSAKNIVAIASGNPSFKTLTAALKAAGLTETLSGKGPFTVFAPTDAAFAALPKATVQALLKPENKAKLVKILSYHVVSGKVFSAQLKSGPVTSAEGSTLNVNVMNGKVMVNNASVTRANVSASNGVIHVINKVLIPSDL